MKKKLIRIVVSMLVLVNFFIGLATANDISFSSIDKELTRNISEKIISLQSNNGTTIKTVGPCSFVISAAEIVLIDGPFLKVTFIEMLLGSRNLHFSFPNVSISVNDLTFSIKYNKNINNLPILNRFYYKTTIEEEGNKTMYTEKHTVIVTGFDGEFRLLRTKPIKLHPAHFWFAGTCEEAIIVT
jgi:hypothetical protein